MLRLVKNKTIESLLNFISKFDIQFIKNDIELTNISKSFLEDYDITIDLDKYTSTKELVEYIKDTITYYQDSQTVYQYYEKDMFSDSFDILDDEWTKICYHLNKCIMNGGDENYETIIMYLAEKSFRDE